MRRARSVRWVMVSVLGCSLGCSLGCAKDEAAPALTQTSPGSPALPQLALITPSTGMPAAGSLSPRLQLGAEGTVAASWLEPEGKGFKLQWRQIGRDAPVETVVQGADLLQNWADVPAVAVLGTQQRPVALWPALHPKRDATEGAPGYGLQWSRRASEGWTPAVALPNDVRGSEYGFVSIAVLDAVRTAVFWLDGRASSGHHGGQMQLRSAVVTPEGIVDRRLVDGRVCDCCQTSAAATPTGPVVVYRDRSESEVRDMWLAGPGPDQRRQVGADAWRVEGCPVNGPAVSVRGASTAVAWFTAPQDEARVRVAFAEGNAAFGEAISVDDGQPVGRVDLVWISAAAVAVSWIEKTSPSQAELRVRVVNRGGARGPAMRVAATTPDRRSGFPQLESADATTLLWAWTDAPQGAQARVRIARAEMASLLRP